MFHSKTLKWITGTLEVILALPVVGVSIVLGSHYIVLPIMFVLHLFTFMMTKKDRGAKSGSVIGMVASCIGWLPLLTIAPHLLAAFFLFVNAAMTEEPAASDSEKNSTF